MDIGTAQGCLPVQVAHFHPHITGGGFDLPELSKAFADYVCDNELSERLRFYPGSFFRDDLPAADVLVFGRVLHNWDLATKKMLLRKAYQKDANVIDGRRCSWHPRQSRTKGRKAQIAGRCREVSELWRCIGVLPVS